MVEVSGGFSSQHATSQHQLVDRVTHSHEQEAFRHPQRERLRPFHERQGLGGSIQNMESQYYDVHDTYQRQHKEQRHGVRNLRDWEESNTSVKDEYERQ